MLYTELDELERIEDADVAARNLRRGCDENVADAKREPRFHAWPQSQRGDYAVHGPDAYITVSGADAEKRANAIRVLLEAMADEVVN